MGQFLLLSFWGLAFRRFPSPILGLWPPHTQQTDPLHSVQSDRNFAFRGFNLSQHYERMCDNGVDTCLWWIEWEDELKHHIWHIIWHPSDKHWAIGGYWAGPAGLTDQNGNQKSSHQTTLHQTTVFNLFDWLTSILHRKLYNALSSNFEQLFIPKM